MLVAAGVRLLTRRPHIALSAGRAVLALLDRVRRRSAADDLDRVDGFIEQLRAARLTPAHAAAATTYALLNWLLDVACLGACVLAVGGRVGVTELLLAFCAGMAASSITLIPAGLGIIDSALIVGLLAGGADTATAIAAVVLYRIISFGFVIGTGWIFWLIMRRRQTHDHDHPQSAMTVDPFLR